MVKFLLTRDAIASGYDLICSYALVKLNTESKDKIERLNKVCQEEDVLSVSFFDKHNAVVFLDDEKMEADFEDALEQRLGENYGVEITLDEFKEWDNEHSFYTDCHITKVYNDSFLFTGAIKHGQTEFETKPLKLEDFEKEN